MTELQIAVYPIMSMLLIITVWCFFGMSVDSARKKDHIAAIYYILAAILFSFTRYTFLESIIEKAAK